MPTTRKKAPAQEHQPQPSQKVIKAYGELLSELRIRSINASYMMYDQSDKYGKWVSMLHMGISAAMGLASANLSRYIPGGKGWLPQLCKGTIGAITVTFTTFKTGSIFLVEKFEKKQELFNQTGARWQKLELNIRRYLDTADDTLTREAYDRFTEECIQERFDICCLAKPEPDILRKFNEDSSLSLERYKKKKSLVAEFRAELDRESTQEEPGDD